VDFYRIKELEKEGKIVKAKEPLVQDYSEDDTSIDELNGGGEFMDDYNPI